MSTMRNTIIKLNELEIPHVVLCPWTFFEYVYFCRAFWMQSCDVRQDNCWDQTHCAIFRCTTNTGHHKEYTFILKFHMTEMLFKNVSHMFRGGLPSFEIAAVFGSFSK